MVRLINLVAVLCILSITYCLFHIGEVGLYTTSLLPFSFLLFTVFFSRIYKSYSDSIVFNIFIGQAIVRYCLLPVLISVDDVFISKYNIGNLNIAALVMIFELMFIFIVFTIFSKKQKISRLRERNHITPLHSKVFILLILCFALYYTYYTGAFNKINLVWNASDYVEKYITGEEDLDISNFGVISFNLSKSIIALLLISLIYKSNKIKQKLKKWLYLLVILLSGIFIVGISRFSFILFIVPLLVLLSRILSKEDFKKIFILASILLSTVLIITTIAKFTRYGNTVSTESILSSSSINAYFAGPGNIAVGINAYEKIQGKESALYLFNDTLQNIPLLSQITSNEYKTTLKFNEEIYGHNLYADQIVPLSISGIFHFSFLGIFFYSSLFITIALLMERLSYRFNFIGYKYVFIFLSVNMSLVFMINIGSSFGSLVSSFLFLLLPFFLINKIQKLRFK